MEFALLGWPDEGPTLELDYRAFAYAGKFVMSSTGKAVARERPDGIVGAIAFDPDRADPSALRIRYVTVREDRQGEGIGPRLLRFGVDRARERGFERVRIAVNNPYAYEASYRAGFAYTGETTGVAELVLEHPGDGDPEGYRAGLDRFRERDLSTDEESFLEDREGAAPPATVESPEASGTGTSEV